jgi:AGZA family xanthine/uracil permease-like MFS transporter
MRWFVRGDIDGFFGLALDNLVQLLLINALCAGVLGFPPELIYGRVLPGAAVSLLVGNLFYSWQALRLARREGREDVCALPYGINTVSLFAHVFLIMLPVKLALLSELTAQGLAPDVANLQASTGAWEAGLLACVASGVIELLGAFVAEPIRRATPRAALLSTLAGIALGFIALGFLFRTFAHPVVGLTTLGVVLLVYFGRVRFKGGIPGGLVAVVLGVLICALSGAIPALTIEKLHELNSHVGWHAPHYWGSALVASWERGHFGGYLSVIVPMGLFNLIGSLQNIESAEAAGDRYDTASSLAINGLGSVAAGLFGSCFPTTIYIGHPGWKEMGARAGYSVLNGLFFTVVGLTGVLGYIAWAVPVDAGMAIVLWIGIIITAQAFQATPADHAPAVAIGLLPGVAAWGVLLVKAALRVGKVPFDQPDLAAAFEQSDTFITGGFALEQGFIFTSIVLSATTVALIERQFHLAARWCVLGAVLSAVGLGL